MSAPPAPDQDPAEVGVAWCLALLDGLMAGGVRHLILSPGSRSTPVILAAQRRPGLTLTPILDERSAAFFALGLARAGARPVALLATSGSAPAHWYPAVMEASAAAVPLILLSADRPPEWRGWGANQTADQTRLFGAQVRAFHDPGAPVDTPAGRRAMTALGRRAAAVSQGLRPGPVHINLPLREPLVSRADAGLPPPAQWPDVGGQIAQSLTLPPGLIERLHGRGLIYCGPDHPRPGFPAAVARCAAALGVPLLADPLSELRCGTLPGLDPGRSPRIARYKTLVRNPQAAAALRPDWVLRFGRAPISKTVLDWLPGIPLILVDPAERWSDPAHELAQEGSLHLAVDPTALCHALAAAAPVADPIWLARWTRAEGQLAALAADYLADAPWCEAHLIGDLMARLPAGEGLLCANSLPIRQFETWSGSREAPLAVFGNRGVSGIDGQLSTLAGLNAAGIPTTGLLGDLSFLHDLSGLMLAARLDRPCIVINNGGGRIFDYLPQHGLPDFERLWRTPRPVAIEALAGSFGLSHRRVGDSAGWRAALAEGLTGAPGLLIEVMIDAEQSREIHLGFRQRVAEAQLV
ncbi:2-succinyl-5-enolpyruvyl-6-hydroxy-3-cyclohexene-1-carboxylic-acid synthase [uncultured Thiodictyon sp.]|uniref:2-succinyl-5-enolpyruvyl-6-hydroxy-3- cyclohexene-1-carboxylic-acid synthase n=1 Tax=uncultured Thiodictyon sp. TaxID=1846217 RepID=UPI0025EEA28A|nr:2-succinyl-5-enolpyruvyl-6-hydroxy-3-cyclohexene-1-carboxylic-acid synthase [uncultured Thiodictyon sp.]